MTMFKYFCVEAGVTEGEDSEGEDSDTGGEDWWATPLLPPMAYPSYRLVLRSSLWIHKRGGQGSRRRKAQGCKGARGRTTPARRVSLPKTSTGSHAAGHVTTCARPARV